MFDVVMGYLGKMSAIMVVVWSCLQTLSNRDNKQPKYIIQIWLQLLVYHGWLWVLWLLVWAIYHGIDDGQLFYWVVAFLSIVYLYMVKIEPKSLFIREKTIDLGKNKDDKSVNPCQLAVVSDIHLGIFFSQQQLQTLIKQLNQLPVDAILITGDWLYHAGADLFGKLMMFKALNKPCYTVLSEADIAQIKDKKTPDIEKLNHVLTTVNVQILDEKEVQIAGLDIYGAVDGTGVAKMLQRNKNKQKTSIIMVHDIKTLQANPQTLVNADENVLIVTGQTHGGQVYIPLITPYLVKAISGIDTISGLTQHDKKLKAKVSKSYYSWTNTGVGMSGLPFRCGCMPSIDILTIV